MAEQTDSKQTSFASYYDVPEYPLFIIPPRKKLIKGFINQAVAFFLLSFFSFGIIWGVSTPVFVFFLFKHHALSKVWAAYKYSRLLFWLVTIIMLVVFFIMSYFLRSAILEWINEVRKW